MTRCSSCGHQNDDGSVFCANCNHFLAWSTSQVAEGETPAQAERDADPEQAAPEQPSAPPPAPKPVMPTRGAESRSGVPSLISAINDSEALAADRLRPDLIERLAHAKQRIESRSVTVAVVGEFKRGKSTLVNALIQTSACPVDADIVTAVPTLVKYGEKVAVTAYLQRPGDPEPTAKQVGIKDLARLVSEAVDEGANNVRSVELRVPHRLLRSGLCLLDTPGVGGLDSVHGQVTLASLNGADALLFVTDASQELTAPELDFLKTAVGRCPMAAVVVTKTDLYLHWRRVVELTRQHVTDAGLDLPVIPVSSFLRLRASTSAGPELGEWFRPACRVPRKGRLPQQHGEGCGDRRTRRRLRGQPAGARVRHGTDRAGPTRGEPGRGQQARPGQRAGALADRSLVGVAADARRRDPGPGRRRGVRPAGPASDGSARRARDYRRVQTRATPGRTRRHGCAARSRRPASRIATCFGCGPSALSDTVSRQFNLDAGAGVELELDDLSRALSELELASASTFSMPGGRLGSLMLVARTSVFLPMMAFSVVPVIGWVIAAAGAATLGVTVGGKLLWDEGKRQRGYRQTQAKAAAAKFIDEVAFQMNKATRDGLRRTQRRLRDEFASRATSIQASTGAALEAARRAATLGPDAQAARSAAVDAEAQRLVAIRSSMRELAGRGADG